MNLTKANIKDLKKVTVKIVCSNGNEGSGTIVSVGENIYVLTAAHVVENETHDSHFAKDKIAISFMRNSRTIKLSVDKVSYYNRKDDAAILHVVNPGNMPTSGLDQVRLLTTNVSGPAELCGFHKNEDSPKHYTFENRGAEIWAIDNIQLRVQSLEPARNFEGVSGGGIFYQDTNKVLYMAAYMLEVGRYDGNNNEFVCKPSSNFISSGLLNSIVDERCYEFVADPAVACGIDSRQMLNSLDRSGYELNQTGFFIENDRTKEIIDQLRDDDTPTLILTALSGMGKSKLIYEAFKGTEREQNRYYAKYNAHREQLTGELKLIFKQNLGNDGIVIVDDCPMDLITEVISIRDQYNDLFRLILVHHDYFNEELERMSFPVIRLKPQEMEERIGLYISEELEENEQNKNDILVIKKLASGYPQMAIELVKAYKKNKIAGPEAVTHLMPKLLNLTTGSEKEEKKVWQTLSLCLPFPYKEATHEGFEYLLKNNHVTPLNGMEYEERRSIAAGLVRKYCPTLIDVQGMWLYVRPFPLAVWLTAEWFKNVCNTQVHFKELMTKMRSETFKTQLDEARYKMRGQYHLGDKEQMELSEKLFAQLASEFIDKKTYANEEEVNTLLEDNEYIPIGFVRTLVTTVSDEQLEILFDTIFRILTTKSIEFYSPFLGNLSSYSKYRKPLLKFLERLRNKGQELLYVSLMAVTENEELSHFYKLFSEQKKQVLEMDYLPVYLNFFKSDRYEHYLLMLKTLKDSFPDRPNNLIAYVVAERFTMRKDEHPEAIAIVKDALLKYQINGDTGYVLHDYSRILIETLRLWHDSEFAKQVNSKFIEVYSTQMVHLSTKGIFTELLKSYFDDVWPEFVKAFLGADTFLFYYQVKDELGSGFSFGKGPLFDAEEGLIKQLCLDNPESAPARIASMVPCFDNEVNMFNKWIIWLLDNFGEQRDVRDNISSNLGSFSWTGNISPYYERNIKCFEYLLNHSKQEVREWAQKCINDEKKLLDIEKNKEDFMHIRYEI